VLGGVGLVSEDFAWSPDRALNVREVGMKNIWICG
jgi:hypothetical protein